MNAVREFPPNPHTLVIHTDELMTDQIVETFLPGSSTSQPAWARNVLGLPGARVLSLNAYKVRLQKRKECGWRPLIEQFEAVLRNDLGVLEITDMVETESPRRRFAWHGESLDRQVFEGKLRAAANPIAAALFDLHGVAEVIFDQHEIEVRKAALTCWGSLSAAIEARLAVNAPHP